MQTRYVKALPENVKKIEKLLKDGFYLYGAQKGFDKHPIMLIFQKKENKDAPAGD